MARKKKSVLVVDNVILKVQMGIEEDIEVTEEYIGQVGELAKNAVLLNEIRRYLAEEMQFLMEEESERVRGRIQGVQMLLGRLVAFKFENAHGLKQETMDNSSLTDGPYGSAMNVGM